MSRKGTLNFVGECETDGIKLDKDLVNVSDWGACGNALDPEPVPVLLCSFLDIIYLHHR